MSKKRIISSVLAIVFCVLFTACSQPADSKVTSETQQQKNTGKKADISIPEEITMEFFGMDLLKANRATWEKHIFSLNELGGNDNDYITFMIGDYEVSNSYLNFENTRNFSSIIEYKDGVRGSQILFDEKDNLTKIDIRTDMGEAFHTSFLNIGDNVKDYFETSKAGLWEKFLSGEEIVGDQGWFVRYSTVSMTDFTYDVLQVVNSNVYISYMIKDEVVDYIMVNVIGELSNNNDVETEPSIFELDSFDFYVNGMDISTMTGRQWLEVFNLSQLEDEWIGFFDDLEGSFNEIAAGSDSAVLTGTNLKAEFYYNANNVGKFFGLSMESMSKLDKNDTNNSNRPSMISFSKFPGGYYNIELIINGECPLITSNCVMPGDNIKTFLNSYEEDLYEKIVSLSDVSEEYRIGPYYFCFQKGVGDTPDMISMGKNSERVMMPLSIFIDGEIVTTIQRSYSGSVSGFDEIPVLW